jgi:hypothetical protein
LVDVVEVDVEEADRHDFARIGEPRPGEDTGGDAEAGVGIPRLDEVVVGLALAQTTYEDDTQHLDPPD